ncbi:hypothetical protein Tco_0958197 [Tanacetum coccineum]
MTPTTTSSDGVWPCPFRGFHCCPDGEVFPRLISHLKRLHLPSDERKCVLREVISTNHGLHMAVEETLKGKDDGITTLVKSILDGSVLGSFGQGGGYFLEEGATGNTNIKQCLRKVADGHFTAAVKVLSSSGVAPYSEIDSVFSCIKSFPNGTSCGRDGLRAQHILDALCGEGSATATDLLKVSPWKGVVRFGKKGKLAPRYVGPFKIVECVRPVAYRLKLPQELSCVHDTFHVSNLKKCLAEPDVQVPLNEIEIDENL